MGGVEREREREKRDSQNRDRERDALVNDAMAKPEAAGLKQNHKNRGIYFQKLRNHKLRKKKKKKKKRQTLPVLVFLSESINLAA